MQFRFLGWQDCPDWLLAQISEFSSLSSIKFKGLCQLSIDFLTNKHVADDDVGRFVSEHNDVSCVHRFLYSISFMMKNATSYKCDTEDFEKECTHLGLPPEHSKMLARVYASNLDVLKQYVKNSIPKDPALESVTLLQEVSSNPILRYNCNGKTTICQLTSDQLCSVRSEMEFIREVIKTKFRE
ncbi:hypothetical protein GCK32_004948 [Trichostrongylus colubriformis]|uniref:COMM domain-containing protein n=1 Tax=Trichostrongylus colubriformis TaxID=6319 RepID=A0AAN8F5U3_TRICO